MSLLLGAADGLETEVRTKGKKMTSHLKMTKACLFRTQLCCQTIRENSFSARMGGLPFHVAYEHILIPTHQ